MRKLVIMEYNIFNPKLKDIFVLNNENEYEAELAQQCFNIVDALIIAIDLDGKITLANKKACEILESEERELIGKKWKSFLNDHDGNYSKNNPLSILNGKDKDEYVVISGKGNRREIAARHIDMQSKDGQLIGNLITGEDITDYLKVQRDLKNTIDQYRVLARNIPDINMYLFDKDLRYIIAEGSEMRKRGIVPAMVEGKKVAEVLDDDLNNKLLPLFKACIKGENIATEYSNDKYDYTLWMIPLKNDSEGVYAGMCISQNITKDKEAAKKLKQSKNDAEKANNIKSEFLANISHEIRTPLNAIVGFSEQLQKTTLNDKQTEFVKIIDKSSEHLLTLVNEILVLTKIEAGKVQLEKKPFNLSFIVSEVHGALKIRAEQKNIDFNYHIDKQLDTLFIGDYMRLRQVLINMASNAIKFTDSGFVEIKCFKHKQEGDKVFVRFDIIDTGIGIPAEKTEIIFDQFRQADSTITRKYGGTGLGLSISKRIIEMQGGKIKVSSQVGVGSQFTFTIPFWLGKSEDFITTLNHEIDYLLLKGKKVLIADDDSVNRLLGKTIMENLNCSVDLAIDGIETVDKVSAEKYDVILLDIHMPGKSGIEVAHFIRGDQKDKHTKILAVTAEASQDQIDKYFSSGMDGLVLKPYKEAEIFNKIIKVLNIDVPFTPLKPDTDALENNEIALPYNLHDLQEMAKGDKAFMVKMLKTFISNAEKGLEEMMAYYKAKRYIDLGETAHRLLPSFRHLKAQDVIDVLTRIKENTLIKQDYSNLSEWLAQLKKNLQNVVHLLKIEVENN